MRRNAKVGFPAHQKDNFRRPRHSPDDCFPVRNMKDWGCDGDFIYEPRYADRAYDLCSFVGGPEYNKIQGIVDEVMPPTYLAKQKMHKDPAVSQDMVKATPGRLAKDLTSGRTLDRARKQDPRKLKAKLR